MNRREWMKAAGLITAGAFQRGEGQTSRAASMPAEASDGWVSLFNGRNLDGWYTMLQQSGRGVAEKRGMVTVEQGMLHIMGDVTEGKPEAGYVSTFTEYENVHIRAEYKWGVKRYSPRMFAKRDNGILYGLVGEDKVWPRMVELQIEENDVGDFYLVDGIRGIQDSHGNGIFGIGLEPGGWPKAYLEAHKPKGPQPEPKGGRMIKDGEFEKLDDWNVVEVIHQGDRAAHIVNGRVVNVVHSLEQPDPQKPGSFIPLTKGKIAIELEFAEIWFRRFEVKALAPA